MTIPAQRRPRSHISTTPHDINRFRIAALSLDDYAAGLATWPGSLMTLGNQPTICSRTTRSPDLKKVTADASGFVALTQEGMAGTSQDLPAAEAAAAGVLPCSSAFVVRPDI